MVFMIVFQALFFLFFLTDGCWKKKHEGFPGHRTIRSDVKRILFFSSAAKSVEANEKNKKSGVNLEQSFPFFFLNPPSENKIK